ncbi:MAG: hypothetical protein M1834_002627 [Cirrosporium novae-zelandiae]|nr:MAG: hypothetical protein M1834_002627 [Cirrosporium novae-zelandiae]
MPSSELPSPAKRPGALKRSASSRSAPRITSPSTSPPLTSNRHSSHKLHPRAHVVGHGRVPHSRNPSYGKNLSKLSKLTLAAADGAKANLIATSPQSHLHSVKRNSTSHVTLPRNGSHVSLKKNHSDVTLKRNPSAPRIPKSDKARNELRRGLTSPRKLIRTEDKNEIHFDMGSPEMEEEWTEESTSQSPATTRKSSAAQSTEDIRKETPSTQPEQPSDSNQHPQSLLHAPLQNLQSQGQTTESPAPTQRAPNHSHLPDADVITSRLLQRQRALPKMSSVSATASPPLNHTPPLNNDQASSEGISRFLNGASSGGPDDLSSHPGTSSNHPQGRLINTRSMPSTPPTYATNTPTNLPQLDPSKRVQSAILLPHHHRDPSSTLPSVKGGPTPESRTQQKLNLQRQSSIMDPPAHPPPFTQIFGPQNRHSALLYDQHQTRREGSHVPSLSGGMSTSAAAPGMVMPGDVRLARQYDEVTNEYRVVCRYRSPVLDALKRLEQLPGVADIRRHRITSRPNSASAENREGRSNGRSVQHRPSEPERRGVNGSYVVSSGLSDGGGSSDAEGDIHAHQQNNRRSQPPLSQYPTTPSLKARPQTAKSYRSRKSVSFQVGSRGSRGSSGSGGGAEIGDISEEPILVGDGEGDDGVAARERELIRRIWESRGEQIAGEVGGDE